MEDLLINPNIAYLVLVAAFLLAGMATLSPGTGILEIAAVFMLLLAGWELYNLPVNLWALGIIFVGFALFILAVRRSASRTLLVLSILAVILGTWFLFRSDPWWVPVLNPLLFIIVTLLTSLFLWVVTVKVTEARTARPDHDLEALIGAAGEAKTSIFGEGSVQVAGELWSARSKEPIPAESHVRVIGREGFILDVELIPGQNNKP